MLSGGIDALGDRGLDPTDVSFTAWFNAGLNPVTTPEQQALLGCGPFYDTFCDIDGIDFANAEASMFFQSWPGFEGTIGNWDLTDGRAQPGTQGFKGGPVCTRYEHGQTYILPGCRGPGDKGYDPMVDGTIDGLLYPAVFGESGGQQFRSELAALSFNGMMLVIGLSAPPDADGDGEIDHAPFQDEFDVERPFRKDGCSFAKPLECFGVKAFINLTGVQRATMRAGGSNGFGRRDFAWQIGTPLVLRYEKRNVLGFSMDFAEDVTKSNWGLEFTWIEDIPFSDANQIDGITKAQTFNLTISVDRPTFINFLNSGRTFFINSQWFFQYTDRYQRGFSSNGPWNVLATFFVSTGYFQDRLLPAFVLVWDFQSNSGAFLPQVTYKLSEAFFVTVGVAAFWGREEPKIAQLTQVSPTNRVGRHANKDFAENGLSLVRERDEVFLRVKWTF